MDHADQQDRRRYELSVLRDVAQALNTPLDLSSLLRRTLEKVAELLGLDTGWVLLLDESTGTPYAAATQNLPPGLCDEPERMTGWCYCLESFIQGKHPGAANVGVVKCSRLRQLKMAKGNTAGLRFHASIPLKVQADDETGHGKEVNQLGMLNVASTEWRELTEDELDILETIGGLLGVAIERAQLHEQRLEAVQIEERLRLAREIHDTIAQDLSAIAMQLDTAEVLVEQAADPANVLEHIKSGRALANKGLRDVRRSVLDLRAEPLEGRTLQEALLRLVQDVDAKSDADVAFEVSPPIGALPPAVEIGMYRIGQEAVQNAIRHASADRIEVHLAIEDDAVRLEIRDDGDGFDAEHIVSEGRTSGRFGLVGMRERARLLGGSMKVESTPGVGTRITAVVPRPPETSSAIANRPNVE